MLTVSHGFYAMKRRVFHVEMLCVGSHISHISKHSRGISILVIFTSPGYLCFDLWLVPQCPNCLTWAVPVGCLRHTNHDRIYCSYRPEWKFTLVPFWFGCDETKMISSNESKVKGLAWNEFAVLQSVRTHRRDLNWRDVSSPYPLLKPCNYRNSRHILCSIHWREGHGPPNYSFAVQTMSMCYFYVDSMLDVAVLWLSLA